MSDDNYFSKAVKSQMEMLCGARTRGARRCLGAVVSGTGLPCFLPTPQWIMGKAHALGQDAYERHKKIGKGTFGTVFLARHKESGEMVVLKEVELRGLSSKDLKMTKAEVGVLKRLSHPNIIAYRDSFHTPGDGTLTIVMEHAEGGDLGSLISKRAASREKPGGLRFSEIEVLKVLAQCVDALAYCHGTCHLLHRDLSKKHHAQFEEVIKPPPSQLLLIRRSAFVPRHRRRASQHLHDLRRRCQAVRLISAQTTNPLAAHTTNLLAARAHTLFPCIHANAARR